MAKVIAVCISEKKGEQKHQIQQAQFKENHGIVGDAHAGNWHRQISLLGVESVKKIQDVVDLKLEAGAFAENLLVEGITLYELPIGSRLKIGEALCEVTQIGKECHNNCVIKEKTGDCVMPREGIFVKVIKDGKVKSGDDIKLY